MNDYKENYGNGWISIHRSIEKHWVFQNDKWFKWWIIMLMKVNHAPGKFVFNYEIYTIEEGQSSNSLRTWAALFNCSTRTVSKFFTLLEKDGMLKRKIIGKGKRSTTLITIENYAQYQNEGKHKVNTTQTQRKHKVHTNNNDNNYNKVVRFVKPTPKEVLHYMTEKGFPNQAERFVDFYEAKGWMIGKNKMKDWKSAVRNWNRKDTPSTNQPKIQL